MKTFNLVRSKGLLVCLMSVLVLFSSFKELDPQSVKHPLLNLIYQRLDAMGIDVMHSWKSDALTENRPVLAPLSNYILRNEPNPAIFKEEWVGEFGGWTSSYRKREIGFILGTQSKVQGTFREKWVDANPEKRLFISFAREDKETAMKIKQVLSENGYTVFTYLSEDGETLDAKKIAFYMTTASERLVIDTETARFKSGVLAEAFFQAKYMSSEQQQMRNDNPALQDELKKVLEDLKKSAETLDFPSTEEIAKAYSERYQVTTEEAKVALSKMYDLGSEDSQKKYLQEIISKSITGILPVTQQRTYSDLQEANVELRNAINSKELINFVICSRCHLPLTFPVCVAR